MRASLQQITITGGGAGALAPKIKESSSSPSHICQSSQRTMLVASWHRQAHNRLPFDIALILISTALSCHYHHNSVLARFSNFADSPSLLPSQISSLFHPSLSFVQCCLSSSDLCCPYLSLLIRNVCLCRYEFFLFLSCSAWLRRLNLDCLIELILYFDTCILHKFGHTKIVSNIFVCDLKWEGYWAAGKAA